MSGIYIHVPYCKRKCDYCDFYSVVTSEGKASFATLVEKELILRGDYLPDREIETIYFGGGTPSMLESAQITDIIGAIAKRYTVSKNPEITLEANPDDISEELLKGFRSSGVNRLSIGVQSFSDLDLKKLGRRHNALQAIKAVNLAYKLGFDNISIDLIYGLPYSNSAIWKENLLQAFDLPVNHLSCYHLIYEEGTPLDLKVAKGLVKPVSEDQSVEQFQLLQELSSMNGFIHYEISNLAKEGYFSRHNTSYWKQIPYLGLGPSAHSYNGTSRDWNPKSIGKWQKSIENETISAEKEVLTSQNKLNDYLITSLRTVWGADINLISQDFGSDNAKQFLHTAEKYIKQGVIEQRDSIFRILPK
ncbi:MAG: radical SAM family heme chaperone HemW, partial [Tenuifilaceae bacterium]|nr:radical SAM family heme chaperone HemW [Tenuifilaceae bacterium]